MAILIHPDGREEAVNPSGDYLVLATVRAYFPSGVMDTARVGADTWLLVDDLGHSLGLADNPKATALYQGNPPSTEHRIVGPALLCNRREVGAP